MEVESVKKRKSPCLVVSNEDQVQDNWKRKAKMIPNDSILLLIRSIAHFLLFSLSQVNGELFKVLKVSFSKII